MALFPAYSEYENVNKQLNKDYNELPVPEAMEAELLNSDTEEKLPAKKPTKNQLQKSEILSSDDFYIDHKLDCGNLRVSTLYYPGRPQYSYISALSIGTKRRAKEETSRWKRYFSKKITQEVEVLNSSTIERQKMYRKLLVEAPNDQSLWEAFIDFQEVCDSVQSALDTACEAYNQLSSSSSIRERLLTLMKAVLPRRQFLEGIRDMLVNEKRASVRTGLWARLVLEAESAQGADGVLAAALADTRAHAPAYPRLLLAYGTFLREAGLWERLVLAIELLVAMNFPSPPALPFPPPHLPGDERRLQELEDEAARSGLPSSAVWVRVERARAAAHWRPAGRAGGAGGAGGEADPQRAPLPHDVADLLVPLVGAPALEHLAVRLLLIAKVPLVPGTSWAARALGAAGGPHQRQRLLAARARAPRAPRAAPRRAPAAPAHRPAALLRRRHRIRELGPRAVGRCGGGGHGAGGGRGRGAAVLAPALAARAHAARRPRRPGSSVRRSHP